MMPGSLTRAAFHRLTSQAVEGAADQRLVKEILEELRALEVTP